MKQTKAKFEPVYRRVLRESWQATWSHKRLFFWGLFAGLLGNAGEYQFLVTSFQRVTGNLSVPELGAFVAGSVPAAEPELVIGLGRALVNDPFATFMVLVAGLIVIAISAFFIWLTITSVVSLVHAGKAVAGRRAAASVGDAMTAAQKSFGSVLVLTVLGRLVLWFLAVLLGLIGALALFDVLIGVPLFLVAFITIVPALFAISFVVRFAVIDVVLNGDPLFLSVQRGAALLKKHWLVTAELGFLLFAINLALGLGLALFVARLVIPMLVGGALLWQMGLASWGASIALFAILLFMAFLFAVGAFLGTFQWLSWTNLFLRLKGGTVVTSKVVRIFGRVFPNRPVRLTGRA